MNRIILTLLSGIILLLGCGESPEQSAESYPPRDNLSTEDKPEVELVPSVESEVPELLAAFRDLYDELFETQDEDGALINISTESEFHDHFNGVATEEVSQFIFDTYFEDRDDGIYVIPATDYRVIDENEEYELSENEHILVSQDRYTALTGPYVIEYVIDFQLPDYVITDFNYDFEGRDLDQIETTEVIVGYLNDENYPELSGFVSEEYGLTLAPYLHITDDTLVFDRHEVSQFGIDETTYHFGYSDGEGAPLDYTPQEYFDEFLHEAALNEPDEIFVDAFSEHGQILNNTQEAFDFDVTVVEYHHEGTDEYDGLDWRSLHFVYYEREDGQYDLVAILSDEWTI